MFIIFIIFYILQIEKRSGLFPKDAIKVDQLFIDEKKEIQVPTQVMYIEKKNK